MTDRRKAAAFQEAGEISVSTLHGGAEGGALSLTMDFVVELEQEEDGRWIAEVPDLPGVMAYGASREDGFRSVVGLALRVLADRIELGELAPDGLRLHFEES